jgi:hypothetical protein
MCSKVVCRKFHQTIHSARSIQMNSRLICRICQNLPIVNANIPKLWHMVFKVFGYAKFSITTEPLQWNCQSEGNNIEVLNLRWTNKWMGHLLQCHYQLSLEYLQPPPLIPASCTPGVKKCNKIPPTFVMSFRVFLFRSFTWKNF